jgi:hypothetical protein
LFSAKTLNSLAVLKLHHDNTTCVAFAQPSFPSRSTDPVSASRRVPTCKSTLFENLDDDGDADEDFEDQKEYVPANMFAVGSKDKRISLWSLY